MVCIMHAHAWTPLFWFRVTFPLSLPNTPGPYPPIDPSLLKREVHGGGGLRNAEGVARLRGELVVAAPGQTGEDDVHLLR